MQPTPTPASPEPQQVPQASPPSPETTSKQTLPPSAVEEPQKTAPEIKTLDLAAETAATSGTIRPGSIPMRL